MLTQEQLARMRAQVDAQCAPARAEEIKQQEVVDRWTRRYETAKARSNIAQEMLHNSTDERNGRAQMTRLMASDLPPYDPDAYTCAPVVPEIYR